MSTTTSFGAPPASDLTIEPTDEQVAFFRENGFLAVERITTDEEIDWLRPIFEAAFDESDGKMAPQAKKAEIQTMFPELRYPELMHTTFLRNSKRFAAALLGADESALSSWGHMIRKPVVGSRPAPWHQDEAYWEPEVDYPKALGSWLPLHDVTVEMGTMQFIPGSHRHGVFDHVFWDGDPAHNLLEAVGVDTTKAVACPLPKGGCTFHDKRTLHFTEPNSTDEPRYAYPIEHQVTPSLRDEPRRYPWVDEYRAAVGHDGRPPKGYIADGGFVRY
jgi:ectoine hydroxylase-related dioxygenase (phytanoyl-CoA dioxygenase family)